MSGLPFESGSDRSGLRDTTLMHVRFMSVGNPERDCFNSDFFSGKLVATGCLKLPIMKPVIQNGRRPGSLVILLLGV
jgi:hypothetical protein